jgi:hypothetical protein
LEYDVARIRPDENAKPWCSMEWETIRGILLNRRKDDAVKKKEPVVHLEELFLPRSACTLENVDTT